MAKIHPVILSGGPGTRLWPLSRAAHPKPFLRLTGDASLFQQTLARVADAGRFAPPVIVCDREHRFLAARQAREAGAEAAAILLEPEGRNTAPAIAVAAMWLARDDPGALLLVLPSDHLIDDLGAFHAAVETGAAAAGQGWLVTFGIAPDRPETGYGYIRRAPDALAGAPGCFAVAQFVEKPEAARARDLLASGGWLWNSGLFLFTARALLAELDRHAPEVETACRRALDGARSDLDFLRLGEAVFSAGPSLSLDHAVMEASRRAAVVPAAFGWSDLGTWDALARAGEPDARGNVVQGDVLAEDCRDSLLHGSGRLVAALGLEDMLVVETADAVLVAPRARAQEVRALAEALGRAGREEAARHRRVDRPWGSYERVDAGPGFQVKRLILRPGASISLQRHRKRSEHWVVVRGTAEVTREGEVFTLRSGDSAAIPQGALHRLHNPADEPLHIVEVQCGDDLDEADIERLEDLYGRR